ncbi:MAG: class II aldolase/adducin family protein [Christensenellales bacterium]|jgi:ribulose-5-phosphate 4-epimerase/fuculose-1-phosphate aldolase
MNFLVDYAAQLMAFTDFSGALGARPDYVQGGGGNTSVKMAGQWMAIKASGFCLSDIRPDHAYAVLNYPVLRGFYRNHLAQDFENVEASGSAVAKEAIRQVDGLDSLRPSVEAGFHSLLDGFVAHTHSVYANLAACSDQAQAMMDKALADAGYGYVLVPYVDPGARLTFAIQDALTAYQEKNGQRPELLLLQNHGIIAHHDDAAQCLCIHEDANQRFAAAFGTSFDAFPAPRVRRQRDAFVSDTPWLAERLRGDAHPDQVLLEEPLYPDQMVFFKDVLGKTAVIDRTTGLVHYSVPEKNALTLEETLCAVVFIREILHKNGLNAISMGEAARRFIDGWESEKYRKSLAERNP